MQWQTICKAIFAKNSFIMSQEEKELTKDENQQEETTSTEETNVEHTEITAEEKVEKLEQQLKEQKDKYLRLFADFDNFKKRTAKERLDLLNTAGKDTILSVLPILDDFERAIMGAESAKDVESVKEGMLLIKNKMFGILEQKGLKAMESVGESFDAEIHEAITEIPAPNEEMKGKVIDQIEKGYYLNDKIIRYAKVVVGK